MSTKNPKTLQEPLRPIVVALLEQQELIQAVTDKQAGQLLKHLFRFLANEPQPIQDPAVKSCFEKLKPVLLSSIKNLR